MGLTVGSVWIPSSCAALLRNRPGIPGTKTAGSAATLKVDERPWPWIQRAVPSPLKYQVAAVTLGAGVPGAEGR